ncbi:MAG: CHAT domain-containing protein [Cyanobacteria bacterium P01_D01_bin.73]
MPILNFTGFVSTVQRSHQPSSPKSSASPKQLDSKQRNSMGWRSLGVSLAVIGQTVLLGAGAITAEAQTRTTPNPKVTVERLESVWEGQYEEHFERDLEATIHTPGSIAATLRRSRVQTGRKSAVLYAMPEPYGLELRLVTEEGEVVTDMVPAANIEALAEVVQQLRRSITNPLERQVGDKRYLGFSQQLYQWMIAPVAQALEDADIDVVIFCMGEGLRAVPLAALHDGEQFLVEKYAVAQIPGFSLFDARHRSLKDERVLAMGASEFQSQVPLPGVPVELNTILGLGTGAGSGGSTIPAEPWKGSSFLNSQFTLKALEDEHKSGDFGIIHLATHAEFRTGKSDQSYIQLWSEQLTLDKLVALDWTDPKVELLVLSACQTAVGDAEAEMGFAGLAVNSGVRSAMASLWVVSDRGTLALMGEFYRQLKKTPTRVDALRETQLAMLRGEVVVDGDRITRGTRGASIALPLILQASGRESLDHPYYWSAFSMIGNPW